MWTAKSVLQARIKMAMEAGNSAFDRSAWDVEKWKKALVALGGGDDEEEAEVDEGSGAGTSKGGAEVVEEDGAGMCDEGCKEKA